MSDTTPPEGPVTELDELFCYRSMDRICEASCVAYEREPGPGMPSKCLELNNSARLLVRLTRIQEALSRRTP